MVYVKAREIGKKRFLFLTSNGGLNPLRVHASRFDDREKAQDLICKLAEDNPEFEFKLAD